MKLRQQKKYGKYARCSGPTRTSDARHALEVATAALEDALVVAQHAVVEGLEHLRVHCLEPLRHHRHDFVLVGRAGISRGPCGVGENAGVAVVGVRGLGRLLLVVARARS